MVAKKSSASLWPRATAMATLHHSTVIHLGTGQLPVSTFAQLCVNREAIILGVKDTVLECQRAIAEASEGADSGKWVSGTWKPNLLLTANQTAAALAVALDDAYDVDVGSSVAVDAAIPRGPSEPALALQRSLCAARGPIAQLGGVAAVLRTVGWVHATLLGAGLDGGGGGDGAYSTWIDAHAKRGPALADACDAAFDAALAALDGGATRLSVGGALSDVECAVALREAMTASSLLFDLVDAAAQDDDDDGVDVAAGDVATGDGGRDAAAGASAELEEAHAALEAVEPGSWQEAVNELQFVRGVGLRDAAGRQVARRAATDSWTQARSEVRG